jgi:hypothetical protein
VAFGALPNLNFIATVDGVEPFSSKAALEDSITIADGGGPKIEKTSEAGVASPGWREQTGMPQGVLRLFQHSRLSELAGQPQPKTTTRRNITTYETYQTPPHRFSFGETTRR